MRAWNAHLCCKNKLWTKLIYVYYLSWYLIVTTALWGQCLTASPITKTAFDGMIRLKHAYFHNKGVTVDSRHRKQSQPPKLTSILWHSLGLLGLWILFFAHHLQACQHASQQAICQYARHEAISQQGSKLQSQLVSYADVMFCYVKNIFVKYCSALLNWRVMEVSLMIPHIVLTFTWSSLAVHWWNPRVKMNNINIKAIDFLSYQYDALQTCHRSPCPVSSSLHTWSSAAFAFVLHPLMVIFTLKIKYCTFDLNLPTPNQGQIHRNSWCANQLILWLHCLVQWLN